MLMSDRAAKSDEKVLFYQNTNVNNKAISYYTCCQNKKFLGIN